MQATNLLKDAPANLISGAIMDNATLEFLEKKRPELEEYQAHQNALEAARVRFINIIEGIEWQKTFNEAITLHVKFAQSADFPASIVKGANAHPAGLQGLHLVASQFAGDFILAQLGDSILAVLAKQLSDRQSDLEAFKIKNSKFLKQLKLI